MEILVPVLSYEVTNALSKLNADKSPGDDGVSVELLKAQVNPVVKVLVKLFNNVLHEARTLEQWKIAVFITIYKKAILQN